MSQSSSSSPRCSHPPRYHMTTSSARVSPLRYGSNLMEQLGPGFPESSSSLSWYFRNQTSPTEKGSAGSATSDPGMIE